MLSEFCLFYYKGPNEDKVSGSILLPSYIISPLSKDDGVYRKYAFKAEHANMRTYYFAAETKDGMIQWMNSLSLASILQNENKLRPELLARELVRQGHSLQPHMRGYGGMSHSQTLPPGMMPHQNAPGRQTRITGLNPPPQQRIPPPHQGNSESRQPLYANAPPKPKRVNNTSRDEADYSPDNSPERHDSQLTSPTYLEDPQVRHRMPQERRTPEAYGRSKFEAHYNSSQQQKDYEEVYNNGYQVEQRKHSEEVWHYTQQQSRSVVRGQPMPTDSTPTSLPQTRVPRPHSADFLEYEAEGVQRQEEPTRSKHESRQQPQRPKSCIGEKQRPDDFWSEEVYAQKMRESAGWQYDHREVRSQSRGPQSRNSMSRSSTVSGFPDHAQEQQFVSPLQISPARNSHNTSQGSQFETSPHQVPPPAIYQDKSPRDVNGTPRGQGMGRSQGELHRTPPQHLQQNTSYQEDQEVAALRLTPSQYRAQQEAWFTQQREAQEMQVRQAQKQRPHSQTRQPKYHPQQQQQYQQEQQHFQQQQQENHEQQQYHQQQLQYQQEQYFLQQQQQLQKQQLQQQQQKLLQKQQQVQYSQNTFNGVPQQDREPRITVPPSLPQPLPRKSSAPHTPTTYQNVPTNSRAYSDPRPPGYGRLESVTPNPRSSERFDSDHSRDSAGDFRRSASARLPKNKNRGMDSLNHTLNEESGDSNRSGEQVGVSVLSFLHPISYFVQFSSFTASLWCH